MPEDPKTQTQDQDPGQSKDQDPGQSRQSQEPKWLSAITDEGMREEARKQWMLQEDYTQKTQKLAEERKGWEADREKLKQYDQWYQQQYIPLANALQPHWNEVQALLSGQTNGAPKATDPQQKPTAPSADPQSRDQFENWDLLSPNEQVTKLTEHLKGTLFEPAVKTLEDRFMDHLKQREQYWQNYITILTDAFNRKANDPGLDINQFMQKAVDYQTGKMNPLDMAYQSLTAPANQEKLQQEWYERGKKDREQELLNQQQDQGAMQSEGMRTFGRPANPKKRSEIMDSVKEKALKAGIPWT